MKGSVLQIRVFDYNQKQYQVGICALDANKQKDAQNEGPLHAALFFNVAQGRFKLDFSNSNNRAPNKLIIL